MTVDIMLCLSLAAEAQVRFQASHSEFMMYKVALGQYFSLSTFFVPTQYYFISAPYGCLGYVRR
jgi:hypothetical protein